MLSFDMPANIFTKELVDALGAYLGYGAIGLGLAVAVLSAILLLLSKGERALSAGTRFMMFGLALVVVGAGLELAKAHESSAEAERVSLSVQNLPDEFWDDFLLSRQQKLFGTAEPTDEQSSGSAKNGEVRTLSVHVPQGECRFYFAAIKPPAKISVTVASADVQHRSLRDAEYYQTGKICTPKNKASQEVRAG